MTGRILVAGTSSDAGKSLLATGVCRWLSRRGLKVAPFKAQNMSNNSVVLSGGGEIARSQALQSWACGVEPEAVMNPVLIKPGGEGHSHLVVLGYPYAEATARSYHAHKGTLRRVVLDSFDDLASRFDVVVCEGAGSPAEINLRSDDLVNMGLARARRIPTVLVGDIDRGGVFASFLGTIALLSPQDQSLVAGLVINKFRGDPTVLAAGLDMLERVTGRPTLGVIPWLRGMSLDAEDSLSLRADPPAAGPPRGRHSLRVAAVRLPHVSNSTDVDALATEPGVLVRWTDSTLDVDEADLVILPGTRATVADLDWLRQRRLADALRSRARAGAPILGICGGFQMLARRIHDEVESRRGVVEGLGLLPVDISFGVEKIMRRARGEALGLPVTTGFEIHHGIAHIADGAEPFLGGVRRGSIWGTHWHGALDSDAFRRAFLSEVAEIAGRDFVPEPDTDVQALRSRRLDLLADAIERGIDTDALLALVHDGVTGGVPFIPPGAP